MPRSHGFVENHEFAAARRVAVRDEAASRCVVKFLNLLCDSRTSHETLILLILLVLVVVPLLR